MTNPILGLLTHRRLERYRVSIPYPVYVWILTVVLAFPIMAFFVLLSPKDGPWLVPFWLIVPLPYSALLVVCTVVGWASGYRSFKRAWDIDDPQLRASVGQRLQQAARELGGEMYWERKDGEFVAVIGMDRELQGALIHSADQSPARISLLFRGSKAVFRVTGRTVTLWDTGETHRRRSIGEKLMTAAGLDRVPGVSG